MNLKNIYLVNTSGHHTKEEASYQGGSILKFNGKMKTSKPELDIQLPNLKQEYLNGAKMGGKVCGYNFKCSNHFRMGGWYKSPITNNYN